MARWSSGQDGGLSRRKREFDSPTGHHVVADYTSFASEQVAKITRFVAHSHHSQTLCRFAHGKGEREDEKKIGET